MRVEHGARSTKVPFCVSGVEAKSSGACARVLVYESFDIAQILEKETGDCLRGTHETPQSRNPGEYPL